MAKKVKLASLDKKKKSGEIQKDQSIDLTESSGVDEIPAGATGEDTNAGVQAEPQDALEETTVTINTEEYDTLRKERDDYLSHLQRLQAEFDNYRKRVIKEKSEMRDFLIQDFISRLLDVIDNMDRALHPDNTTDDVDSYRQGLEMVFQQFLNILKEQGLIRIETAGQVFDPRIHEAVGQVESGEHEPGVIVSEFMPGYTINERVLRAPKVMVAVKASAPANGQENKINAEESEKESVNDTA